MNEINHRRIKIGRQVTQSCRHRRIQTGAILADDETSYFIFGRQEKLSFGAKTTGQCSMSFKI